MRRSDKTPAACAQSGEAGGCVRLLIVKGECLGSACPHPRCLTMRLHRKLSIATVVASCILSLAGARGLPAWATEGIVTTHQVSGEDLIGGVDCTNINQTFSYLCPPAQKGANCNRHYQYCIGAATGQTKTDLCEQVGEEICQDVFGQCAAAWQGQLDHSGCTAKVVPE